MKKVMLLGDSIRMYYQNEVIRLLGDDYEVWKPAENCRFARYTLNTLSAWMAEYKEQPDIIHWNNGLWDVAVRYEEDGCFTSLEDYLLDMKRILRELKKTGAKIIFATITPVNPQSPIRNNADIERYNQQIVELMKSEGVQINDLFRVVYPHWESYICDDYVHLTEAGVKACGKAVADAIVKASADESK